MTTYEVERRGKDYFETMSDLYSYVGLEPFQVLNGNYKAQFVMAGETLYLKYWVKTVNPPYSWIKTIPVSLDKPVHLKVCKLAKENQ